MSFQGLYDIRPATPEDHNFIMATFLRGLYYGDSWLSEIPKDIFMDNYKHIAAAAWASPKVKIKVACLKEDPNVILGYSVLSSDNKAIAWVFVKTAWRRQGIARSLIPATAVYVTNLTAFGRMLMREKLPNVVLNPFYGA